GGWCPTKGRRRSGSSAGTPAKSGSVPTLTTKSIRRPGGWMRFLIDTHCWLWAISAPERLNENATDLLHSDLHTAVFSSVSAAEIGVKTSIGKLRFDEPVDEFVRSRIEMEGMKPLPLYIHHALRV